MAGTCLTAEAQAGATGEPATSLPLKRVRVPACLLHRRPGSLVQIEAIISEHATRERTMTLVVSFLRDDVAIQLSDRRLTAGGEPETEEANKAITVITDDARMTMGFSGLARYHSIRVIDRLVPLLREIAPPDYGWLSMAERLGRALSHLYRGFRPEDRSDLATSLHFIGFLNGQEGPIPTSTFISNYNDPARKEWATPPAKEFRVTTQAMDPGGSLVQALGVYRHITDEDMAPLVGILRDRRPPDAVVGKGVELMRQWADQYGAQGLIGKQISSVILPADFYRPARAEYHSNVTQPTSHGITNVWCRSDGNYAWTSEITAQHGGFAAVPRVGRNVPCPCSSGKKYGLCHGSRKARVTIEVEQISGDKP